MNDPVRTEAFRICVDKLEQDIMKPQAVQNFLNQMNSDMSETNEMIAADDNLLKAIQRFEKAFQTKLKINYDTTIREQSTNNPS